MLSIIRKFSQVTVILYYNVSEVAAHCRQQQLQRPHLAWGTPGIWLTVTFVPIQNPGNKTVYCYFDTSDDCETKLSQHPRDHCIRRTAKYCNYYTTETYNLLYLFKLIM